MKIARLNHAGGNFQVQCLSVQKSPGMRNPPSPERLPVMSLSCLESSSSTRRDASFTAASTKSCSISWSLPAKTSGSIFTSVSCFCPFIFTLTIPPPAVASTRISPRRCSRFSCICHNCAIICCRALTSISILAPPLHIRNRSAESLQHRAHDGIFLESRAQLRSSRRGAPAGIQFNTHAQRLAHHLAEHGAQFLHRVSRLQHLRQRAALRREI